MHGSSRLRHTVCESILVVHVDLIEVLGISHGLTSLLRGKAHIIQHHTWGALTLSPLVALIPHRLCSDYPEYVVCGSDMFLDEAS